jgi:hypothetical protein
LQVLRGWPILAPMRLPLLSFLLVAALPAAAQVYKGVGPDGRPIFTDRPLQNTEPVLLPRSSQRPVPADAPDPPGGDRGFLGSYDAFELLAPEDGVTIRDANGSVTVSLLLDPPLLAGHRLSIDVDGVAAAGDLGDRTQLVLSGVNIGSHRLQARVLDDAGNVVAATAVVHFHLRPPLPAGSLP